MIAEIFQEGENYFQTYLNDVLKLRAKNLEKGQPFNVVDKDIQDNAYNVLITDHINEYNQTKASIESEIQKVEMSINKINAGFNQKIKELGFGGDASDSDEIMDIKKMLELNKTRVSELEYEIKELFSDLNSIKNNFDTGIRHAGNLQQNIFDAIRNYRNELDLLIGKNEKEMKDYIEERKGAFGTEFAEFTKGLIAGFDDFKSAVMEDLEIYRQNKQREFDAIYDMDSYLKHGIKLQDKTAKIKETKEKIDATRSGLADTSSKVFIKNITWLMILLAASLYDYIFLNKIFVDIFDVQGGDPQGLKNLVFGLISWLNLLSGGILLLLIFLYTMGSKVMEKGSKIEGFFIKALVILIVISMVVFSIVDVKLGLKGQIIYKFVQTEGVFIEFVLRLLMLPVLLVGDFILLKMINWDDFYLGDIIFKIFLSPFYLIYLTGKLFVDMFSYLTFGLIIERKRRKVLELKETNEQNIRKSVSPEMIFDVDLSGIALSERSMSPIDGKYLSTDDLSAILPNISEGLKHAFDDLTKINDLVKKIDVDILDKINGCSKLNTAEMAENKIKIDNLRNEQENYLQSYIASREKLISNLQKSNVTLKEIQSSLKKGIMSGYKKYILVNI